MYNAKTPTNKNLGTDSDASTLNESSPALHNRTSHQANSPAPQINHQPPQPLQPSESFLKTQALKQSFLESQPQPLSQTPAFSPIAAFSKSATSKPSTSSQLAFASPTTSSNFAPVQPSSSSLSAYAPPPTSSNSAPVQPSTSSLSAYAPPSTSSHYAYVPPSTNSTTSGPLRSTANSPLDTVTDEVKLREGSESLRIKPRELSGQFLYPMTIKERHQ